MKIVAKYNTFKGISTVLTIGTPIVTLACCSDFFIHRSETAISAGAIFAILIVLLLFKDKILEHWKVPSAFVVSLILFILIILVENIITPVKYICLATMIATGIDELTFKMLYKNIEAILPKEAAAFKHFGFLFTSSEKITQFMKQEEESNEPS